MATLGGRPRRSPPRGLVVLRLTYEDVMTGREPVLALIAAALDGVAHSSSVP
ncbi:hypothetical protein [uncultured Actinomyces sp.]|uniref:hypothetical protein n=1 Tax=uncultured Actinomyces sp. TaxID=249061 RepID=UPI002618DF57|nr:hypothetical protein [uncultured Actinomyces sp.]